MTLDLRCLAEIESIACADDEGDARRLYLYGRLSNGMLVLAQYRLGAPPGGQTSMVIEGA